MKILTQDRQKIIEMPKAIFITGCQHCFINSANGILGQYPTQERAKCVLDEIFQHCRNGKKTYIMPEH